MQAVAQHHAQFRAGAREVNVAVDGCPARQGVAHFHALQEQLEELSQINAELLRRGDPRQVR